MVEMASPSRITVAINLLKKQERCVSTPQKGSYEEIIENILPNQGIMVLFNTKDERNGLFVQETDHIAVFYATSR